MLKLFILSIYSILDRPQKQPVRSVTLLLLRFFTRLESLFHPIKLKKRKRNIIA